MTYQEVYDVWRDAQRAEPFFKNMGLAEFATGAAQNVDPGFAVGADNSRLKRASAAVNRFLGPVSRATGSAGQWVGEAVAGEKGAQYGKQIGEALPRGVVDMVPSIAGTALLLAPEPTGLTKAAGAGLLGLGGLSAASGVYQETDSPLRAGIAGLANVATPAAARVGERVVSQALMNTPLYKVGNLGAKMPVNPESKVAGMTERFAEYLGANVGAGLVQETQIQADSLVSEGQLRPLDEAHTMELVGGQLPFALLDAYSVVGGPKSGVNRSATSRRAAETMARLEVDEVTKELRTYNKDRKLLPAPALQGSAVLTELDENGRVKQVKKPSEAGTFYMGTGQPEGPVVPEGQFVEVNNFQTTHQVLDKIAGAERWLSDSGQKTVSPGKLARALGLTTPEETMTVFNALVKRGVIGEERANGRHAVKAQGPRSADVAMEQLRMLFPKQWERATRPPEVVQATPAAQPVKSEMTVNAKGKVGEQFVFPDKEFSDLLGAHEDITLGEAFARMKARHKELDYMEFKSKWNKAKSAGTQVAFSETGGFKFDQKKWGETRSEPELFAEQLRQASEGQPQDFSQLVVHPFELLRMKDQVAGELKRFLKVVYTSDPAEGRAGSLPFEISSRIDEFDTEKFVRGLEERGYGADEVVLMAANKMQLELGELALKLAQAQDKPRVLDPKQVKEYAEVEGLVARLGEIGEKFDAEFKTRAANYEDQLNYLAKRRSAAQETDPDYVASRTEYEQALQEVNTAIVAGTTDKEANLRLKTAEEKFRAAKLRSGLAEVPERPRTPWDVIADKREDIERYESRLGVSDTEMLGPGDYVYAEAVRFYDDKAGNIAKFVGSHKSAVEGKSAADIELMALSNFLNDAPLKKATRVADKLRRRQVSLERGESWDEAAYDSQVASDRTQMKATAVREQSDTDFVAADPVSAAEEAQTRHVIMSALPEKFSYSNIRQIRKAMGKTTDRGVQEWQARFEKALQMFRDGVLELRKTNKVNQVAAGEVKSHGIRVRPESGIAFKDLASLLNFKDDASTLKWLNDEFMPAMVHVAEQGRRDMAAGKDPRLHWEPVKVAFSESDTGRARPFSAIESSERYFGNYFKAMGYAPEKVQRLSDVAVKIAAAFKEGNNAVVAELIGGVGDSRVVAGAAIRGARKNVVALTDPRLVGIRNEAARNWYGLHVLGHEFAHLAEGSKYYDRALEQAKRMPNEDRMVVLGSLFNIVLPDKVRDASTVDIVGQRIRTAGEDPKEFLADLTAVFVSGMGSESKVDVRALLEEGKYMPDALVDFVRGQYPDVMAAFGAVRDWLKPVLSDTRRLDRVVENVKLALNSMEEVDRVRNQWQHLKQTVSPDFMSFITDPPHRPVSASELETPSLSAHNAMGMGGLRKAEDMLGASPGFFEKVFWPIRQLSQKYPQLRPVADLGYEYLAMARRAQTKILAPFLTEGVLGNASIDYAGTGVKKVLGSAKATEAFNKIALVKNERGHTDETFRQLSDQEMKALMPELDRGLQQSVIDMHRALELAAPEAARVLVNGKWDEMSLFAAKALLKSKPEVGWEQARRDGQLLVNGLRQGLVPPDLAANYPLGFPIALDVINGGGENSLFAKTRKLEARVLDRPWWTPEVRLGRFMVAWREGAAGFDTKEQAIKFAQEKEQAGTRVRVWDKSVRNDDTVGLHPLLIEHFQEIEKAGYDAAMRAYAAGDQDLFETLREAYRPGENTWKEFLGKGFSASLLPRKLREGRETVDVFRGFLQYVSGVTNGVARNNVKHTYALMESDPILRAHPELRKLGRDYIQTVIYPPAREWSALKKLNFLWFMGGNLSSMALEYTQPLISVMPHFVQQTGSLRNSFGALQRAGRDIASTHLGGKGLSDQELALMKRAADEGILDFGVVSDFYEAEDMAVVNLNKLTGGEETLMTKPIELMKKAGYLYAHAMRSLYTRSSRWNNQLTFLTAYRLALDGKVSGVPKGNVEKAYGYAKTTTPTATYTGGPAARPVGLFANSGKFFGAVGAMYSLQSYTYSAISNMARLFQDSINADKRLSPAERRAAQKAFGTMLLGQLSVAGAMGLPLAGGLVALVEQAFQVSIKDDLEKGADWMASLFSDDEEIQDFLSDVAMRGVASRVFGTDIAARTSLGNVLGVDAYNGFSLDTLIGPTGGVFRNMLNTGRAALNGDLEEVMRLGLPRAYAGVVDFAKDGTEVRDRQGRLIMTATPTEQAMMVLGFKPKRLSDYQQATNMMKRTQEVESREHGRFLETAAKSLMAGKAAETRALIMQRAEELGMSPRALAQRVVEVAQELSLPYNPLDDGTLTSAAQQSAIASTFQGSMPPRISETKKLQQKLLLEQRLNVPGAGRPSRREMTRAAMIDQLLAMNPTMSRAQAAAMVGMELSPQSSQF